MTNAQERQDVKTFFRIFADQCEVAQNSETGGTISFHNSGRVRARTMLAKVVEILRGPLAEVLRIDRLGQGFTSADGLLRLPTSVRTALPLPDVLVFKRGVSPGTWVMCPSRLLGGDLRPSAAEVIEGLRKENEVLRSMLLAAGVLPAHLPKVAGADDDSE